MVYVQALQKITKYIYQKKSDAHHNAMKVLLSFFYDLEKIVLDPEISEQEKKEILQEDVKKFEKLKRLIGLAPEPEEEKSPLFKLKAHILSIDWEISDKDLEEIGQEIKDLQSQWVTMKPRMILLQGIDAVGGYIKLMKSDSHGDAIRLINSFYLALEKVVEGSLDDTQLKDLLLSEADKFNRFKEEISDSITPEAIARYKQQRAEKETEPTEAAPVPPSEDVQLSISETDVAEPAATVAELKEDGGFSEETLDKVDSFFDGFDSDKQAAVASLSAEEALRGVDVETEDDDEEGEPELPTLGDGKVAPALSDMGEVEVVADDQPVPPSDAAPAGAYVDDEITEDSLESALQFDDEGLSSALGDVGEGALPAGDQTISAPASSFSDADLEDQIDEEDIEAALSFDDQEPAPALSGLGESGVPVGDQEVATPPGAVLGVDVETEADDDSEEEPLPLDDGELAPALAFSDDSVTASGVAGADQSGEDINQHVDDFFSGSGDSLGGVEDDAIETSDLGEEPPAAPTLSEEDMASVTETAEDTMGDVETRLGMFLDEEPQVPDEGIPGAESLAAVKTQVESLKEGISEEKLTQLRSDLDSIKNALADKPLEKIFVHLISTVVDNISSKTAEFDQETIELLDSVCTNLDKIASAEIDQNQALIGLSNEIANILKWQQRMVH